MSNQKSIIISLIKENRWNSIFFQYLKKIFLFFLIPFFVICFVIYGIFSYSLKSDYTDQINVSLKKADATLSHSISITDKYFLDFLLSPEINSFLTTDYLEDTHRTHLNVSYFVEINRRMAYNFPYIENAMLYSTLNDCVISPTLYGKSAEFADTPWLKACLDESEQNIFMVPKDNGGFYRCYRIVNDNKEIGFLIFELSPDSVHGYADSDELFSKNIVMATHDGVFFSQSQNADCINQAFIEKAFENSFYTEKVSDCQLFSTISETSDYVVISAMDKKQVSEVTLPFRIFFVLTVLMFLFVFLGISVYLSFHIFNSYAKIIEILEFYQGSSDNDKNEIHYISQQILSIITDKEDIEKTLVDKIEQLKKFQISSLNTQITPHFVFNTLNLVNAIIMNIVKKPNDAEKVIGLLSDTFYYSLRNTNYLVAVKDEILYTKKFVEIEEIKLEGNFDFSIDVSPEVHNYKILKFMIQPLVENSFFHGISKLTGKKGVIKVTMNVEDDALVCSVYDNGPKIDSDMLESLNNQLKSENISDTGHIGLMNIHGRIALIWGNANYGCFINSNEQGTTVTVKMPLIKDEE